MRHDSFRKFNFLDSNFFSKKIMNSTISELRGNMSHITPINKNESYLKFYNRKYLKIKNPDFKELKNLFLNKTERDSKISLNNLKQKIHMLNTSKFEIKKINILNKKNNEIKSKFNFSKIEQKRFENFLYRKIFLKRFKERDKSFNNRLNLLYSENLSQYEKLLTKRNEYKHLKGNGIFIPSIYEGYSINKVNEIKDKINFMKGVVDFTFPEIILFKIHFENHSTKAKQLIRNKSYKLPFEQKDEILKHMNMNKTLKLSKSFNILNFSRNKSK